MSIPTTHGNDVIISGVIDEHMPETKLLPAMRLIQEINRCHLHG